MSWTFAIRCDHPKCTRAIADYTGQHTIATLARATRDDWGWSAEWRGECWRNYCPEHSPVICSIRGCEARDFEGGVIETQNGLVRVCPAHRQSHPQN